MLLIVMFLRLNRLSRMLWCLVGMKLFDLSMMVCSLLVDICWLWFFFVLMCSIYSMLFVSVLMN